MMVDMSPRAVTARLRLASELRDLCLVLAPRKAPKQGDKAGEKNATGAPSLVTRNPDAESATMSYGVTP